MTNLPRKLWGNIVMIFFHYIKILSIQIYHIYNIFYHLLFVSLIKFCSNLAISFVLYFICTNIGILLNKDYYYYYYGLCWFLLRKFLCCIF